MKKALGMMALYVMAWFVVCANIGIAFAAIGGMASMQTIGFAVVSSIMDVLLYGGTMFIGLMVYLKETA